MCARPPPAAPSAPVVAATAPAPAPPTTGGSSALKIILIVIAVIVGLGILSVGAFSFFIYRVAKSSHMSQQGDRVKIDSPLGSFSANDPEQTAKDLGVDIYPGAQVQKNGTASMSFGNVHNATASFESGDSADKVCSFYKSKFPGARVSSSDQNRCSIVSNDQTNMISINVEGNGDTTKFQIANVSKKSAPSN